MVSSTRRKSCPSLLPISSSVLTAPSRKTGDKTIDAFKKAAQTATDNVSPASKAGTGGNLTQSSGTKASPSASMASGTGAQLPKSTGAASQLAGSAFVAGLAGAFTFFML